MRCVAGAQNVLGLVTCIWAWHARLRAPPQRATHVSHLLCNRASHVQMLVCAAPAALCCSRDPDGCVDVGIDVFPATHSWAQEGQGGGWACGSAARCGTPHSAGAW